MVRNAFVAAVFAAAVLVTPAAQAHPKLITGTPAPNATVSGPTKIELSFSEKLVAQFSGLDIVMTDMPGMKMPSPMKMTGIKAMVGPDGKTLVATFAKPLPSGTYRLDYHIVSADTHRIQGSYTFKVK